MGIENLIELGRQFVPVDLRSDFRDDPEVWHFLARFSGQQENWESLLRHSRVIVLGEAGAGKTAEFRFRKDSLSASGATAFFLSINSLAVRGLEQSLGSADSISFENWLKTRDRPAVFFLDSLDEAKLERQSLEAALTQLDRALGSALQLASVLISCRVSDWYPAKDLPVVKRVLSVGTSTEEVHVVFLEPLTLDQVATLAKHQGIADPAPFIQAVKEADALGFIQRPLDVEWLAAYWQRIGKLGSYTEMIEENLREKLSEREDRRSSLSLERAREGATELAGIATFCGVYSFNIPGAFGDTESAIDPRAVLQGWSDEIISQLLTRPLFDEATYGRVRIHHRVVQEYLSARWLESLTNRGLPSFKLEKALFREVAGRSIVPARLGPVVAWLSQWNDRILDRAVREAPNLLLNYGDSSALPLEVRQTVLRAQVERYKHRAFLPESFDRASLRRFSTPGLSEDLAALILDKQEAEQLRILLLDIVEQGKLTGAAEAALRVALEPQSGPHLRRAAVRAAAEAGTAELRKRLLPLVNSAAEFDEGTSSALIDALFPEIMGADELVRLLAKTKVQRHAITALRVALDKKIPESIPRNLCPDVLGGLVDLIAPVASSTPPLPTQPFDWLLPFMVKLLARVIVESEHPEAMPVVLNSLVALRRVNRRSPGNDALDELRGALAAAPMLRRALFWERVRAKQAGARKRLTHYWEIHDAYALAEVDKNDYEWLVKDALERDDLLERLLAFDAVWRMHLGKDDEGVRHALVEKLATADARFRTRLERFLSRPEPSDVRMMRRYERSCRATELRLQRERQEEQRAFAENVEKVRRGQSISALMRLCDIGHSDSYAIDEAKIEERLGGEVSEAGKAGFRAVWRKGGWPNPEEWGNSGTTPDEVVAGLIGLKLELAGGFDLTTAEENLQIEALRLAAWEIRFPPWLNSLGRSTPSLVLATLPPLIEYEFAKSGHVRLLFHVQEAEEEVRKALLPGLLETILSRQPAGAENLRVALEIVLGTAGNKEMLDAALPKKCKGTEAVADQFAIWWCAWLERNPEEAIRYLERSKRGLSDQCWVERLLQICKRLSSWIEPRRQVLRSFGAASNVLGRLAVMLFEAFPPNGDRRHAGAYWVEPRDEAASVRDGIVRRLDEAHSEEALGELLRLADEPRLVEHSERLLWYADRSAPLVPRAWSQEEALLWLREFVQAPTTSRELFQAALDAIEDLRLEYEKGELIAREAICRDPVLPEEFFRRCWLEICALPQRPDFM